MMLWSEEMAVVPVTVHLPLAEVRGSPHHRSHRADRRASWRTISRRGSESPRRGSRSRGSTRMRAKAARSGARTMRSSHPRSPRCGRRASPSTGPLPADTMFHARARNSYDAALAMYHDQALIPIKTLAFDEAVNVTLGLPFVRTSPDHGTAFDIAGTGVAKPDSLIAALKLAARLSGRSGHERDRRPAAPARGRPRARPRRRRNRSARISCSTST